MPNTVTVHGLEGQDRAFWRVSPPPTPPHNVADLSEFVVAKSFAATLRGGGTRRPDRVAPGDYSPGAPTDPDVPALGHTVPQDHAYYVLPWW
jgi:hypothetical protein